MDGCQLQGLAPGRGQDRLSSLDRESSCCLGTWCMVSLLSAWALTPLSDFQQPQWWPKDSQALQHERQNWVYQVGAAPGGSVDGQSSDAPGIANFEAAEAEPRSVMNAISYKLEVSEAETFIHWCWLSLPNAFIQEGSKREFFEHVKTPHFHIF